MAAALPELPSLSKADILKMFDRLLPASYLEPLKDPGPGYEYLQAVAEMISRVSLAIKHVGDGGYILTATGGSYATATVAISRPSNLYGNITLNAGSLVGTDDGYVYATQSDAVLGTGLGPVSVEVKAVARGWLWNQPGPILTASNEAIPGPIRRMIKPVILASPYFDPTLIVTQLTEATGGSAPALDGLGADRGLPRFAGESDGSYRNRLETLPDTVTPASIQRILDRVVGSAAAAASKTYGYREGWDMRLMTAYDFPVNDEITQNGNTFSGNVFVYDNTPDDPLANRYPLPRGNFVVALPEIAGQEGNYAGLANNLEQARPAGISVGYILT